MKLLPNERQYSGRDDWLKMRAGNVGASEVACLFGLERPYQMSKWTLWQVKSGRLREEDAGIQVGERAKWGLLLEDAIMMASAEEAGWKQWRRAGYVQHPQIEGMGCSPDFLILDETERPYSQAETKNVDYLEFRDNWEAGEPPPHIMMQAQHQMACTGLPETHVSGLVGGNKAVRCVIERRPKIISAIEAAVEEFWESIGTGRQPPIDGKAGTAIAVRNLYHADRGRAFLVDDGHEILTLIGELAARRRIRADMEKEIREIENQILGTIGCAEIVLHGSETVLTAKSHERKGYEVADTSVRQIRIPRLK